MVVTVILDMAEMEVMAATAPMVEVVTVVMGEMVPKEAVKVVQKEKVAMVMEIIRAYEIRTIF